MKPTIVSVEHVLQWHKKHLHLNISALSKSSSGCVSEENMQSFTSVVNSQSRLRSESCYKVLVMSRTKH